MHTKGPWRSFSNGDKYVIFCDKQGITIAITSGWVDRYKREEKANARLIAACPTMAEYVIMRAKEGDTDAKKIAASFGWTC